MATPSDLTQTGETLILALVNAANTNLVNGPLTTDNVTLGAPAVETGDKNSSVVLTGVAGNGYANTQTFTYNRLDIQSDVMNHIAPSGATLVNASYATVADLVAPLNSAYNLGLVSADISNGSDAITLTDGAGNATVTMAAASLKYIGELSVAITQMQADLATVVTNTELDGLTPPTGS